MTGLVLAVMLAAPTPVSIDWSRVDDATVARCGLAGFQNLILQALVESGFAVVEDPGADGIRIAIVAHGDTFVVSGTGPHGATQRVVTVRGPCDVTISVELQDASRAVARALDVQQADRARNVWSIGVGVAGSHANSLFATPMFGYERRMRRLGLGVTLDLPVRYSEHVTAFEPTMAVRGTLALVHRLRLGASVGLVVHRFWSAVRDGGHFDARFGVPVLYELTHVRLTAMPTFRLRPVDNDVTGRSAYMLAHFGFIIGVELVL